MALSQPAQILLAHDRWATQQLLSACGGLSHEQFHQEFAMGVGSLHATLVHVLGATRGWTDMLRGDMLPGSTPRPRLESEGDMTVEALLALHPTVADEFEEAAWTGSLDDDIHGERAGRSFTFKRGAILTHVTTHAMHHRAQCLNMLRQLGVEKPPPSSVMEWTLLVGTA